MNSLVSKDKIRSEKLQPRKITVEVRFVCAFNHTLLHREIGIGGVSVAEVGCTKPTTLNTFFYGEAQKFQYTSFSSILNLSNSPSDSIGLPVAYVNTIFAHHIHVIVKVRRVVIQHFA